MKKRPIFIYAVAVVSLAASCSFAHAQNLVPNPSFEEYKKLNCRQLTNDNPHPQQTFDSLLYYWTTPTNSIVELLSNWVSPNCSANTICSIPECTSNPIAFHCYPKDGHNLVGILLLVVCQGKFTILVLIFLID